MNDTPLDSAHAAMEAGGDAERLAFFARLADSELFLLLEAEADARTMTPQSYQTDEGEVILAFDTEDRLAAFAKGTAPYAALSGRSLVHLVEGEGLALGINLDVAPSAILLPPEALTWLSQTLDQGPQEAEDLPEEISRPDLPEALLKALDAKLASATGLATAALLARITYRSGAEGHLLAFTNPKEGAEQALATAVSEALTFSGLEGLTLDVTFLPADAPIADAMARQGLRIDLPQPKAPPKRPAPGSDPTKPPKLR